MDNAPPACPDVVLLDIKMPHRAGLETLHLIRDRWPDLPVLILTMYDDPEYVEEAFARWSVGVLKNITPKELPRAVRTVTERRGPADGGGPAISAHANRTS